MLILRISGIKQKSMGKNFLSFVLVGYCVFRISDQCLAERSDLCIQSSAWGE
jgi:hypothetical protein